MPKTTQEDSRSKSHDARRKALHTKLGNRIQSLKDKGMSSKDIRSDKVYNELQSQVDKLSQGSEMAFRRKNLKGSTPPKSSGLSMAKGGMVPKANCGASMKPGQKRTK